MKFTYEDLLEFAQKKCNYFTTEPIHISGRRYCHYQEDTPAQETPAVYIQWQTGGMSGGSCWGTEATPCGGEEKPDFKDLDTILEHFTPKITFLQYKKLDKLIKETEHSVSEYYGNYSDYKRNYIILKELYETLKEL
jgi:hypothetical protein